MGGFKSFLKAAGEAAANGALGYLNLPPIFRPSAPSEKVLVQASELDQMIRTAVQIEQIGKTVGLTGVQKMSAMIPDVESIINQAIKVSGHEAGDDVLLDKAIAGYAQASVDLANALKPKNIPS